MGQSAEERKAKEAAQKREFRKSPEYRAWREANRERINQYKRERRRQRRLADPAYIEPAERQLQSSQAIACNAHTISIGCTLSR